MSTLTTIVLSIASETTTPRRSWRRPRSCSGFGWRTIGLRSRRLLAHGLRALAALGARQALALLLRLRAASAAGASASLGRGAPRRQASSAAGLAAAASAAGSSAGAPRPRAPRRPAPRRQARGAGSSARRQAPLRPAPRRPAPPLRRAPRLRRPPRPRLGRLLSRRLPPRPARLPAPRPAGSPASVTASVSSASPRRRLLRRSGVASVSSSSSVGLFVLFVSHSLALSPPCFAFVSNGQDPRDLALRELEARRVLERAGRRLEAQVEQLLPPLREPRARAPRRSARAVRLA